MNSDDNDQLEVIIRQYDGSRTLSEMRLEWPDLPNAEANRMNLALVAAIHAEVAKWAAAKAQVADCP